ncbi:MAG: hypothetical protein KJ006_13215, partial [Thermoleophilia bacterium]|nr:hypothetical protein [Thermoleophilia bacterium]
MTNGLTLELYDRDRYEASPVRAHLPELRASAKELFTRLEQLAPWTSAIGPAEVDGPADDG